MAEAKGAGKGKDQNFSVYKDRARITMFGRITSNCNVYKNWGKTPVFERISSEFQC